MKTLNYLFSTSFLITFLAGYSGSLQAQAAVTNPAPNNKDCVAPLTFPAPGAITGNPRPVDFCKELVIVEPEVLANLESNGYDFESVFTKLAGTKQVDAFFTDWTDIWNSNFGDAGSRNIVSRNLKDSWDCLRNSSTSYKHLKLIAVINRMDLAKMKPATNGFQVTEPGEGRLIYQLLRKRNNCLSAPYVERFTVILEFGMFEPGSSDPTTEQKNWADRWHSLSDTSINNNLKTYSASLKTLLDDIVVRDQLNQIRTNEQIPNGARNNWELREFRLRDDGSLHIEQLATTPNEASRKNPATLTPSLNINLSKLENGSFNVLTDLPQRFWGYMTQFEPNATKAWMDLKNPSPYGRPYFLMTFNSCNGCHHDQETEIRTTFGTQHIAFINQGIFQQTYKAALSYFLKSEVQLGEEFSDCKRKHPLLNAPCRKQGGINYWNEQLMRICRLEYWLGTYIQCPVTFSIPLLEEEIKAVNFDFTDESEIPFFRYH